VALRLVYTREPTITEQVARFRAQNLQEVVGVTFEPMSIDAAQPQRMRANRDPSLPSSDRQRG
jgi:hypothetical protein